MRSRPAYKLKVGQVFMLPYTSLWWTEHERATGVISGDRLTFVVNQPFMVVYTMGSARKFGSSSDNLTVEAVGPNGRHLVHRMEPLQTVYVLEANDVV